MRWQRSALAAVLVSLAGIGPAGRSHAAVSEARVFGVWYPLESHSPVARPGDSFVTIGDSLRDRILLFGFPHDTAQVVNVWTWDLGRDDGWRPLDVGGDAPRLQLVSPVSYDSRADRILLLCWRDPGHTIEELWSLGLAGAPHWARLQDGPGPTRFLESPQTIFDPHGNRLVAFYPYSATLWDLDFDGASSWRQIPVSASIGNTEVSTAVLDPATGEMVLPGIEYYRDGYVQDRVVLRLNFSDANVASLIRVVPAGPEDLKGSGVAQVYDPRRHRIVNAPGAGFWPTLAIDEPRWKSNATANIPFEPAIVSMAVDVLRDRIFAISSAQTYAMQLSAGGDAPFAEEIRADPAWDGPKLRWRVGGAVEFARAERREVGGDWLPLGPATGALPFLEFVDQRFDANLLYAYRLVGGGGGNGFTSDTVGVFVPLDGFRIHAAGARADGDSVRVAWDAPFGVRGLSLQRREDGHPWTEIRKVDLPVGETLRIADGGLVAGGTYSYQLWFDEHGYASQSVVVPGPSVLSATATGLYDHAEVAWRLGARVERAILERRDAVVDWRAIEARGTSATGEIHFDDRTVAPGMSYRYRLGIPVGDSLAYTAELEVRIPAAVPLAIQGTWNAASGGLQVRLASPGAALIRLEVFDVTGSRLWGGSVAPGFGVHVVPLSGTGALRSGLYFVRATLGTARATGKVVATR